MAVKFDYLVCIRADDPPFVDGSTFDRCCSRCNVRVAVAPDSLLVLKRVALPILCVQCFSVEMNTGGESD